MVCYANYRVINIIHLFLYTFRAGTVESRIRQLVMKLELVDTIDVAHPFVKGFDRTYHCASPDEVNAVARGEVPEVVNKRTKEDIEGQEGGGTVYATSFFIGLEIQPKKGSIFLLKVSLLSYLIQRAQSVLAN
jgi:poly(A) polymerase Pap1